MKLTPTDSVAIFLALTELDKGAIVKLSISERKVVMEALKQITGTVDQKHSKVSKEVQEILDKLRSSDRTKKNSFIKRLNYILNLFGFIRVSSGTIHSTLTEKSVHLSDEKKGAFDKKQSEYAKSRIQVKIEKLNNKIEDNTSRLIDISNQLSDDQKEILELIKSGQDTDVYSKTDVEEVKSLYKEIEELTFENQKFRGLIAKLTPKE